MMGKDDGGVFNAELIAIISRHTLLNGMVIMCVDCIAQDSRIEIFLDEIGKEPLLFGVMFKEGGDFVPVVYVIFIKRLVGGFSSNHDPSVKDLESVCAGEFG